MEDGTEPNRLAYSQTFKDGKQWTFYYDATGRITGMADGDLDRLSIAYNLDGTLTYEMIGMDGFVSKTATGKIPVPSKQVPSGFQTGITRIEGPFVKIPVRVKACKSVPPRPQFVGVTYNYGLGKQYHLLQLQSQRGVTFNYTHTIAPLEGIRTKKKQFI
jgi:YD repeat-containing protein